MKDLDLRTSKSDVSPRRTNFFTHNSIYFMYNKDEFFL